METWHAGIVSLRAPYTLIWTMQFNCVKNCTKNWTEYSLAQHRFPIRFVRIFVSSLCLLVRVTVVDKNKAVVCCLLATSALMLSEKKIRKRKMWSTKWYLKRNISYDAHLLHELLETDVPWDDAIVVSAGKLRKLWDSLSELRSFLCEGRLELTVLCLHYCLSKLRSLFSFFPLGLTSHSKIAQFNWECIAPLRRSTRLAFRSLPRMPAVWAWGTGQQWTLEHVGEIRHHEAEQFTALKSSHQQSNHPEHSGSLRTDPNTKTLHLN